MSGQIKKICDGLYVGTVDDAKSDAVLASLNIRAIINVSGVGMKLSTEVFNYALPSQELLPTEQQKTVEKLNVIVKDAHLLMRGGNVLVVCGDGKNKSILVAGYYQITKLNQPYADVISNLEMLYFTDQQKIEEAEDNARIAAASDPDVPPEVISQEELQRRTTLRSERNAVRCLTMASFARLLRMAGGAKK